MFAALFFFFGSIVRRKCNSLDGGAEKKVQLRNHKSVGRWKVAIKLDLLSIAESKLFMQQKKTALFEKKKQSHHCCFYSRAVHAGEEGQGTLETKESMSLNCTVLTRRCWTAEPSLKSPRWRPTNSNKVAHPVNRPVELLTSALMGQ